MVSSLVQIPKSAASLVADSGSQLALEELPADQTSRGRLSPTEGERDAVAFKRGFAFWMVFAGNLMVDLPSALDLTAVSTALPTITSHLHGSDFIWAGSAYAIASTAILPTVGGLVSVFGRKPIILGFILLFALGSALCGAAQNMAMFIAGRLVQGLGGGGCIAVTEIIYADLIPLPERGKFYAITASVWALASAVGPPIGGAFSGSGAWRWLFFLNLPLCGIAFVLVSVFLHGHSPRDTLRNKIARMDWLGLAVVISSTVSVMMALTWAGVRYPWPSAHVLVPLCLGAVGLVLFFIMELYLKSIEEPTIPAFILKNRTTLSGYLGTFFHGIAAMALIYYLPVYFQASKLASPVRSGLYMFGVAFTIPPFAILMGVSAQVMRRYCPQNYIGWIITIAGFGLLSTLDENSTTARIIGYQIFLGAGVGIIWIGTQFPILAPLPFSNNAHALAFFTFTRVFAQSWGTVMGGTILQNTLQSRLPKAFIASLPHGTQLTYVIIPEVPKLAEPLKTEVRAAFARSTSTIWHVMIGISGLGLLTCLLMREVPMRTSMDEKWGLEDRGKGAPDSKD
ncbi:iron permease [Fomitopsis serialis]|uniref:iron permease n=1 Tax=Fomitopsis serialis TaxID=139415 RepID=UPI002007368D|nr:iron permease [Neoantrodia serialis]KAH9918444.1 iron permease [Neoantrodia serialis]